MKVTTKGHTIIIKDTEGDIVEFLDKVDNQYNSFKDYNLILDISHDKSVDVKNIKIFSDLAKKHKKVKKSLVFVVEDIDYNKVPASIIVVPTQLEAQDLIEMDEIERDLGF
ncbi:ribonuclease Z [Flavobacterium taihuense]|uniref:Ribonuclease Z n=1 Tax=Flavobacterium taihuense TaxID=2857508 RepID=A0ABS6Y257_9FLAO|nr:ribonuclease Z [Flavobacterium taihuense]MBW4362178.1 ribonuclease Z [Flavobacterium taihuense]